MTRPPTVAATLMQPGWEPSSDVKASARPACAWQGPSRSDATCHESEAAPLKSHRAAGFHNPSPVRCSNACDKRGAQAGRVRACWQRSSSTRAGWMGTVSGCGMGCSSGSTTCHSVAWLSSPHLPVPGAPQVQSCDTGACHPQPGPTTPAPRKRCELADGATLMNCCMLAGPLRTPPTRKGHFSKLG